MFCSIIIPTIGRPSFARAVHSALEQTLSEADWEVILVNDSGHELEPPPGGFPEQVRCITTQRRQRCFARNTGAAIARGQYLLFLDDDDWLAPDALQAFYQYCKTDSPACLSGGLDVMDGQGTWMQTYSPDDSGNILLRLMVGEWIPITSLFQRDVFFAVGGFDPFFLVSQDNLLWAQIACTHDIEFIPHKIYFYTKSQETTTTDYTRLPHFLSCLREVILNKTGVHRRLLHSARTRPLYRDYWHGKLVQLYLKSIVVNLREARVFIGLDRLTLASYFFLRSMAFWVAPNFWKGVLGKHQVSQGWMRKELDL